MTTTITTTQPASPVLRSAAARKYARASKSPRTLQLYAAAWREFEQYAATAGEPACPASPALVGDYLSALADHGARVSTIELKRSAIVHVHQARGLVDPTANAAVKAVMGGIRRQLGSAPQQKAPVTAKDLRRIVRELPRDLVGLRDRALILLGFAGAFRRSELVALDVADLNLDGAVLRVTVRHSKTDQEARGFIKVIPRIDNPVLDPATALRAYLDAAQINSGPVFRRANSHGLTRARLTAQSVALVVKQAAGMAGLDPRRFSGHSLRAGFVTSAYRAGARDADIMELTGHQSRTTLDKYIRAEGRGAQSAVSAAFSKA